MGGCKVPVFRGFISAVDFAALLLWAIWGLVDYRACRD